MAAVGDIYRLVIQGRVAATNIGTINVFHFRALTTALSAASVIGDWRGNVETGWRALISADASVLKYSCSNLIPFATDYAEQNVSLAGTDSIICMPPSSCAIVTWRTGLPGRRKRGRTYISPLFRSEQTAGQLLPAYISSRFTPWCTSMLARYGSSGSFPDGQFGVWSRLNGNQEPPHSPAGFQVITSYTIQNYIATMGTRRYGRGF